MFADAVTIHADDRRLSVEHDGFAESTQVKRDFADVNEFEDLPRSCRAGNARENAALD